VQPPLLQSHKLGLAFLPSIDDITPGRDPRIILDPLFPQHSDEGYDQRDAQTGEEDGLSSDDTSGDI
jgi:hypothetical protein